MRKIASRKPMKRKSARSKCSGWRARTWLAPQGRPRKPTENRMRSRKLMGRTWMLLGTVLLVLSACNRSVEPVGTIFVSGRIDGDTVDISSKIPGRVVNLTVREGDLVKASEIVAWLSSEQEEAIRDSQKARIVSDERRMDQLEKTLVTNGEKV